MGWEVCFLDNLFFKQCVIKCIITIASQILCGYLWWFYTIVLYHGWPKLSTGWGVEWSRVEWCWLNLYDIVHSQTLWWTTHSQLLALFKLEFKVFTVMCTRNRLWVPFTLQKDIGAMAEVQYQFQMCFCWLYWKDCLIAEKRNHCHFSHPPAVSLWHKDHWKEQPNLLCLSP